MAVIDTVRPISVEDNGGGTTVPSGTKSAVTSDNSDATYVNFPATSFGNNWSLRVGPHTPPANHQRHRLRGRIRIRTDAGTCTEDIDLGRGSDPFIEFTTLFGLSTSFQDLTSAWFQTADFGLGTPGALSDLNMGGGWMSNASGGATAIRTAECYLDIDCRARPDFTPEVRDAAGVDQSGGTVTDTNQPVLFFGGVSYDGLPPLNWAVEVAGFGTSGSGTPPTQIQVTGGLANGSYTATFTVRSTIRGADPFEHTETIDFDVDNSVPPPSPPIMSVTPEFGGYRVDWNDPGGQTWDNDYVVAELWRADCNGEQRIATVPNGLNGTYLDLAIPQLDPITGLAGGVCTVHTEPCDITYSVRYWGYVSTFVELPDTIPDDLILGWPGTAASIPSGWSRVTALDGFYPRGSNGTGAPSATGGAATHQHTTPGHVHFIGSHGHSLGGSVSSSGSSTTSARFNGASKDQANQPHTHARPGSVGTASGANSGNTAPATNTADNVPPTREVIWISSDGAQAQYPVGILGWATEAVSGWDTDALSSGRFLRGAAAAGNGGAQTGAATHTHAVASHSHTGFNHGHSIGGTGLSSPVGTDAGTGSSTPRWLPRHTHPMTVDAAGTGSTSAVAGGTTGAGTLEPLNRRLRVLRNVGGGTQTRIIGLYMGTVAGLDPLLTLCNGASGTPDMRTWFARDAGSDSINSTGGASTHTHTTPNHQHTMSAHAHDTDTLASATSSFEAPSFGDLGDSPTTSHTHTSGATANATPATASVAAGTTNAVSHVPVYKEAHFVRLDGTISGGPLPVPELKTSDFASITVPAFTYADGLDRIATRTTKMAVGPDRTHAFPRTVTDDTPLGGGLPSVSTTLAGEDITLAMAVEGQSAIDMLESMLAEDEVYWSPLGGTSGWYAPGGWNVRSPVANVWVLTVTMVRIDWPPVSSPEEFL
jgi:hypothetical protein